MKRDPRSSSRPLAKLIGGVAALALLLPASASAADQIAFTCDNGNDLCVVDPDSGSPTNLTNTAAATEKQPYWSPDGTKLAFYGTYPSLSSDVYTLNVASPTTATNVSQTTNASEGFYPIDWSPSGARIAFTTLPDSSADPNHMEVKVGTPDGTLTPFAVGSSAADESYPTYSPDGTKIAFQRGLATYIGNADGTGSATFLTNGGGYHPDWSSDGTRIAITTNSTIRVVRVDGTGAPVDFGNVSGFTVDGPYFSPDSTRVMWATQNSIFIRAANGSGTTTTITPTNGRPGNPPAWSPDSTRIAFAGFDATFNNDLYVANADGTGTPRDVSPDYLQSIDPQWKPTGSSTPPVDPNPPPGTQTRPPVTISLAQFSKLYLTAGRNPFVTIAYVTCLYPNPTTIAAGCKFDADAVATYLATGGKGNRAAPKKKIKFASGDLALDYGASGDLQLKVSKAGKKLLKPGKTIKLAVTINQHVGDDPIVTTKKTLKLKVPKRKGK